MKRINIFIVALGLLSVLPSCNKFLDTMPDKRTELNRTDKIKALLVSAYPSENFAGIVEHRTDNVVDQGSKRQDKSLTIRENYHWEPNSETTGDVTHSLFTGIYGSISVANQALEAIEALGTPKDLLPSKGEALLCRAYGHFIWLRVFSMAYNSQTSTTDIGMPYFTKPETKIGIQPKRLTVAESYARIALDIEEALPLIDDSNYSNGVQKYHFNKKAAYAFAAQFYLFYEQWEKAKKFATMAIGENPSASLRNIKRMKKLTNREEWTYEFISVEDPANLMLQPTISSWGWAVWNARYSHSLKIASNQTLRSKGGWGNSGLPSYDLLYGGNPTIILAKLTPLFEVRNQAKRTGYYHTIFMPFTVDKTLMVRAEAEVLLGELDAAAADLKMWYLSKEADPSGVYDAKTIASRYAIPTGKTVEEVQEAKTMRETISKPLSPLFKAPQIQEGTMQYQLLQAVLHAKRILGIHVGERWDDIKRYRIEIRHSLENEADIVLTKDDLRRAIQVPSDMIAAGLEPNPQ